MNRRSILKNTGLFVACVSVPKWLTGCGEALQTVVKKDVPFNGLPIFNEDWQFRGKQLEDAGVVKSRKNVPDHNSTEQELAQHLPILTFGTDKISININHPMEPDHWITTIYCRDQHQRVFGLSEFLSSAEKPFAEFVLPDGTTDVSAFSFCSRHLHWCEKVKRPHP